MSTYLANSVPCLPFQDQVPSSNAADEVGAEKYRYAALPSHDHFRILELLPGESTESVRCRLHVERFEHTEDKYAAISYVWGDPKDKIPIVCDNHIIEVTRSLADALRHIRDPTKPELVWADAICIDQDNNIEKGHQVKRMGKVYENAKEVLAWLGKDGEGIAEDCFNLIRETNEYMDSKLEIHGGVEDIPTITRACPISFDRSRWDKVCKLFGMTWFSRLWVVQEAGLAKQCKLLWGQSQLSLAELCELSLFLHQRPDLWNLIRPIGAGIVADSFITQCTYEPVKGWMATKPLIKRYKELEEFQKSSFLDVLHTGRNLKTSFEVDRVYAFLGNPLARKCGDGELLVEPNYGKTFQEVYFETAYSLLAHPREAPHLLARVDHHSSKCVEGTSLGSDDAFPSWVPRWDKHWRQCPMSIPRYWYRAGGLDRQFNATVQVDRSLLLPAIIFDRLVWTSPGILEKNLALNADLWYEDTKTANKPFIDSLFTQVQQAFYHHCRDRYSEPLSASTVSIEDDFSLTMVRHHPYKSADVDLEEHRRNFTAYLQAARHLVRTNSAQTQTQTDHAIRNFGGNSPFLFERELIAAHNRLFAITELGRFGLVPYFAEPNDVCCICLGMKVPLILWPREDGRYGLVGDSYVHGVMAGEVIEGLDKGEVKQENIVLV
jgi:hypothetical protein